MSEVRIRVRANRSTGELEVEGPLHIVSEWWDRLWPELAATEQRHPGSASSSRQPPAVPEPTSEETFGEFYSHFSANVTDVDKVLIAATFVQRQEADRAFTTKAANQHLLDQNVKVANASENVRRLMQSKRVFGLSDGRYRVSEGGLQYLETLRATIGT